jgi:hypothetical protein
MYLYTLAHTFVRSLRFPHVTTQYESLVPFFESPAASPLAPITVSVKYIRDKLLTGPAVDKSVPVRLILNDTWISGGGPAAWGEEAPPIDTARLLRGDSIVRLRGCSLYHAVTVLSGTGADTSILAAMESIAARARSNFCLLGKHFEGLIC